MRSFIIATSNCYPNDAADRYHYHHKYDYDSNLYNYPSLSAYQFKTTSTITSPLNFSSCFKYQVHLLCSLNDHSLHSYLMIT